MLSKRYDYFNDAVIELTLVPFRTTGNVYLKSPENNVGIPPKNLLLLHKSYKVL